MPRSKKKVRRGLGGRGPQMKEEKVAEAAVKEEVTPMLTDDEMSEEIELTLVAQAIRQGRASGCSTVAVNCARSIVPYLAKSKDDGFSGIKNLMELDADFVALIKKWMTASHVAVNLQGVILMHALMSSEFTEPYLDRIKNGNLIESLINLLTASDVDVCEQAVRVSEAMMMNEYLVKELVNAPGFFQAFSKLSKRANPRLTQLAASALCSFSNQGKYQVTPENAKSLTPILRSLMGVKDEHVLARTVSCIGVIATRVPESFDMFVKAGGLILGVVSLLSNEAAKEFHTEVGIAIGAFALNKERTLALMKILRGTDHLKHYYQFWTEEKHIYWSKLAVGLLHSIMNMIDDQVNVPLIVDAMLNCGILHSILRCLNKDVPLGFQQSAAVVIGRLCTNAPESTQKLFVDAGVIPLAVELLRTTEYTPILTMANCTIGSLAGVKGCRDKLLELGAVKVLLGLLKAHKTNKRVLSNCVTTLQRIMDINPKAPVKAYFDLPETIKGCIQCLDLNADAECVSPMLYILEEYIKHGEKAVKKLVGSGVLYKVLPGLSSDKAVLKEAACNLVVALFENATRDQRMSMWGTPILTHLEGLVNEPHKAYRQIAIRILHAFLKAEVVLTEDQITFICQQLLSPLMEELYKVNSRTQEEDYYLAETCLQMCLGQAGIQVL